MKKICFGNVIDQVTDNAIIAHGCNARGVMGGGVAAEVKAKYPHAFDVYAQYCHQNRDFPEKIVGNVVFVQIPDGPIIANAITQLNFGRDPKVRYVSYQAIQRAFASIARFSENNNCLPVHYPMIGAGLGNGDWSIIHELLNNEFVPYPSVSHTLWLLEP